MGFTLALHSKANKIKVLLLFSFIVHIDFGPTNRAILEIALNLISCNIHDFMRCTCGSVYLVYTIDIFAVYLFWCIFLASSYKMSTCESNYLTCIISLLKILKYYLFSLFCLLCFLLFQLKTIFRYLGLSWEAQPRL